MSITDLRLAKIPLESSNNNNNNNIFRDKIIKIARIMPCTAKTSKSSIILQQRCSCTGWRQNTSNTTSTESCICGHKINSHADLSEVSEDDIKKLFDYTVKIDEHLAKHRKTVDTEYEDFYIISVRAEMAKIMDPLQKSLSNNKLLEINDSSEGGYKFRLLKNDGTRDNLTLLTGIKVLFTTALPHMPANYITRVVYDYNHYSLAIVKEPSKIVGGICYRPFFEKRFIEIVFFAIDSDQQVKGFGSKLMNYFKDYIRETYNIFDFMVYADDLAIGFFKKHGFTKDITLDQERWGGYIKDYTGATLMQCTLIPKVKYSQIRQILEKQKRAVREKLAKTYKPPITYKGLTCFQNGAKCIDPMLVPGIKESGWTPQLDQRAKDTKHKAHYATMIDVLKQLKNKHISMPFREPVNANDVPDYYDIIKDPMDLSTVFKRVEGDRYQSLSEFAVDVQKIWDNARTYNKSDTIFYKSAGELEAVFREIMFLNGVRY